MLCRRCKHEHPGTQHCSVAERLRDTMERNALAAAVTHQKTPGMRRSNAQRQRDYRERNGALVRVAQRDRMRVARAVGRKTQPEAM